MEVTIVEGQVLAVDPGVPALLPVQEVQTRFTILVEVQVHILVRVVQAPILVQEDHLQDPQPVIKSPWTLAWERTFFADQRTPLNQCLKFLHSQIRK